MRRCFLAVSVLFLAGVALAADPMPSTRVEELIARLADRDFKVRGRAARDLGNLGLAAQAAVPALARRLHDSSTVVRDHAGKALAQIGLPAIPELIKALTDRDAGIRNRAARALGVIGPEAREAVPALVVAAQKDKWSEVRLTAIAALGEMGAEAKDAAPKLVHLFHDRSDRVRALAGLALQQMGPAALKPLQKMVTDDDRIARLEAMRALGLFGSEAKAAVPALRQAMKDKDARIRAAAAATLGNMGFEARDAAPELLDALAGRKLDVLHRTEEALVALTMAGVPGILEKIREAEARIFWGRNVAEEVQAEGAKDPLTPLLKNLLDKDPKIRARGAVALATLAPVAELRVITPLKRLLADEDEQVRVCASMALARIQRNKAEMRLAVQKMELRAEQMVREIQLAERQMMLMVREQARLQARLQANVQANMQIQAKQEVMNQAIILARTYNPNIQPQLSLFINWYIFMKVGKPRKLDPAVEDTFQRLGPEAIPALVEGMNMAASRNLGHC